MKEVWGREETAGGLRGLRWLGVRRSVYEELDPTSFAHLCPTRLAFVEQIMSLAHVSREFAETTRQTRKEMTVQCCIVLSC